MKAALRSLLEGPQHSLHKRDIRTLTASSSIVQPGRSAEKELLAQTKSSSAKVKGNALEEEYRHAKFSVSGG